MRPDPSERIDRRAVIVWRISGAAFGLPAAIAAGILGGLVVVDAIPFVPGVAGAVILLLLALATVVVIPKIRWMRWRYEVSDDEIYLRHGLWIRKRTLIPMTRVQHVDTKAGPLLRAFGLSSVTVATAGGEHEIPALSDEVADRLRDSIAALARVTEDVV